MSDASHPHCRKCRQPDYACECEDPVFIDSIVNLVMQHKPPPADHPFFDHHPNYFEKKQK